MSGHNPFLTTCLRAGAIAAILLSTSAAVPVIVQRAGAQAVQTSGRGQWNPQEILRIEKFVRPPEVIERIVTTPRVDISFTAPSPDRRWFLRATGDDRGDIMAYGKPHVYLGGVQIDTQANRARSLTTSTKRGLVLIDPRAGATRTITTPANASVSSQVWSPTGTHVAYIANHPTASHIYVADIATGASTQVTTTPLLATFVTGVEWTADGRSIVTVVLPAGRGPAPVHGIGGIEDGPRVRLVEGRANPQSMHATLLEDPHDKELLKHYVTGQLVVIDIGTRAVRRVGTPAMIRSVDASPDGQYFRVTTLTEPFSYAVPVSSFGTVQELWGPTGNVVATLAATPLREGGARGGPGAGGPAAAGGGGGGAQGGAQIVNRPGLQWNPVGPGMVYLQQAGESLVPGAPDTTATGARGAGAGRGGRGGRGGGGAAGGGGDAPVTAATVRRYVNWLPPYGPADVEVIYEGSANLGSVMHSADGKTLFVADSGAVIAVRIDNPARRFRLPAGVSLGGGAGGRGGRGGGGPGADPAAADSAAAPPGGAGPLYTTRGRNGQPVVVVGSDGRTVFVSGTRTPGARWQTEAPRPWLDRIDFETGTRTRIFDSPADRYQQFVTPLDDDFSEYIYTSESPSVIADAFLRDTRTGTSRQITRNVDVAPEVTGAQRKRLQVTRPDSIKFWVEVTLPADWQPGTRLPGVVWFYPREYTSQAAYDASKNGININSFPTVPAARPATATRIWVSQGYAFIEPDSPIIGPAGRMNDNYTKDLAINLQTVVDAVVAAGYVDRDRIGLGGHSYGAFSTVNGLSLTDSLFRAGIAGDGMYNRSLTPFGFQSERRNFFEAQETYLDMSPFFRADKITSPLLLYHAIDDQNVGTHVISSIRMFHALQGLGRTAALYLYPYEDHSVATYASDLDMWARWVAWFDIHVKNATPLAR